MSVEQPVDSGRREWLQRQHRGAELPLNLVTLADGSRPSAVARDRQLSGELKIIGSILEAPVIDKILRHLGLQARAPPRAPARSQALQAA